VKKSREWYKQKVGLMILLVEMEAGVDIILDLVEETVMRPLYYRF